MVGLNIEFSNHRRIRERRNTRSFTKYPKALFLGLIMLLGLGVSFSALASSSN